MPADPAAAYDVAGYPSVLKLDEVASALRLTRQATSRLIRLGRLPGFRVGGEWRTLRSQLQDVMDGCWPPPASGEPAQAVPPELAGYPSVLKLDELARLLRVNRQVAGRLLHHGRLPGFRAGGEWRIRRDRISDLVTGRWTPPVDPGPDAAADPHPQA